MPKIMINDTSTTQLAINQLPSQHNLLCVTSAFYVLRATCRCPCLSFSLCLRLCRRRFSHASTSEAIVIVFTALGHSVSFVTGRLAFSKRRCQKLRQELGSREDPQSGYLLSLVAFLFGNETHALLKLWPWRPDVPPLLYLRSFFPAHFQNPCLPKQILT